MATGGYTVSRHSVAWLGHCGAHLLNTCGPNPMVNLWAGFGSICCQIAGLLGGVCYACSQTGRHRLTRPRHSQHAASDVCTEHCVAINSTKQDAESDVTGLVLVLLLLVLLLVL